jgi:hypothetical protein
MIVCLIEKSKNRVCLSSSNRSSEGGDHAWLTRWAAAAATNTIEEQVARKQPGNGKSQAYNAAVELGLKDWNLLHLLPLLVSLVDALLTKRVDLTLSPVDEIMKKTQDYVDRSSSYSSSSQRFRIAKNRDCQWDSKQWHYWPNLHNWSKEEAASKKAHNSNLAVARTVIGIEEQEANTKRACNLK